MSAVVQVQAVQIDQDQDQKMSAVAQPVDLASQRTEAQT
jgi:hypothetical protein